MERLLKLWPRGGQGRPPPPVEMLDFQALARSGDFGRWAAPASQPRSQLRIDREDYYLTLRRHRADIGVAKGVDEAADVAR